MPRVGIVYEQVAEAAEALAAAGENVTIARVRDRLGTGSPNTVHKHLVAWQATRPAPKRAAELPDAIQAAILREIERQTAAATAEVESRLHEAEDRADELARVGQALESEVADLTESLAAMRAERDLAQMNLEGLAEEVASLKAEVLREREAAESARIQAAELRGELKALRTPKRAKATTK